MKKRALWGIIAPFAISILLVPSAFADSLDYVESIGQVEASDTINYVIEATSDGGYVVGGQIVQCNMAEGGDPSAKGGTATLGDCLGDGDDIAFGACEADSNGLKGDDGDYEMTCLNYIAKFKQDGTKEWLSVIDDSVFPVAVGETNTDYRLLTTAGTLYTFAKANGAEGSSLSVEIDNIEDAIINNDGTIAYSRDGGIGLLAADGSIAKTLLDSEDEGYYTKGAKVSRALVRSGDSFVIMHWNDNNEGIVKVSNDLNTITEILSFDWTEVVNETGLIEFDVLSADEDDNVLVGAYYDDLDSGSYGVMIVSINKDGEIVAAKTVDELLGIPSNSYNGWDPMLRFLDDYTVSNPASGEILRLAPDLTVIDSIDLAESEIIYDATLLTDKSMAAVGRSSISTNNYTVDGGINGTYLRIITAKSSDNGNETNPNTDDEIAAYLVGGGMIVAIITGVGLLVGRRR